MKSAKPNNPANFTEFFFWEVDNPRVENVRIDSTDVEIGEINRGLHVKDSSNIQLVDSVLTYDADNVLKDKGTIILDRAIFVLRAHAAGNSNDCLGLDSVI